MLNSTLLIAGLGVTEVILILVVVLLLFGGKKIPELMRGLGKGIKEFKTAQNGDGDPATPTSKEQDNK
ncbi:MAG: twin-arginine translocase TatA/TatE family subunit [Daejeonella sp.]